MIVALQNAKGSAAIAVAPSHGSTNPQKDKQMNSTEHSTGPAAAPVPDFRGAYDQGHKRRIGAIQDELAEARFLNRAMHMMTRSLDDIDQVNAFQIIADKIEMKLIAAGDWLSEIREEMA